MQITPKQKKFADEQLETGEWHDGVSRKDFLAIQEWLKVEKNKNVIVKDKDVYFIQCSITKRIKIGIAENVATRYYKLNAMSHTRLGIVLVIDFGGRELEQHLHRKYEKYRVKGEWFEESKEIVDFIEDIKKIQQKYAND